MQKDAYFYEFCDRVGNGTFNQDDESFKEGKISIKEEQRLIIQNWKHYCPMKRLFFK